MKRSVLFVSLFLISILAIFGVIAEGQSSKQIFKQFDLVGGALFSRFRGDVSINLERDYDDLINIPLNFRSHGGGGNGGDDPEESFVRACIVNEGGYGCPQYDFNGDGGTVDIADVLVCSDCHVVPDLNPNPVRGTTIYFDNLNLPANKVDVMIDSTVATKGFQFEVTGINPSSLSGGEANTLGFQTQISPNGVGYSVILAYGSIQAIPDGVKKLTTIHFTDWSGQVCFGGEKHIMNSDGTQYLDSSVTWGDCVCDGDCTLPSCGDGTCNGDETQWSCSTDCGVTCTETCPDSGDHKWTWVQGKVDEDDDDCQDALGFNGPEIDDADLCQNFHDCGCNDGPNTHGVTWKVRDDDSGISPDDHYCYQLDYTAGRCPASIATRTELITDISGNEMCWNIGPAGGYDAGDCVDPDNGDLVDGCVTTSDYGMMVAFTWLYSTSAYTKYLYTYQDDHSLGVAYGNLGTGAYSVDTGTCTESLYESNIGTFQKSVEIKTGWNLMLFSHVEDAGAEYFYYNKDNTYTSFSNDPNIAYMDSMGST